MYGATATAAQNGVGTHLLVAPLPQPHQCEQVHLIQWNPIDSGTVAAPVAAPCERTYTITNSLVGWVRGIKKVHIKILFAYAGN